MSGFIAGRWLAAALSLAAAAIATAAPPASPPASGPVSGPVSPAAATLAELVAPAEASIEAALAQLRQGIAVAFAQELGADWATKYPGLLEAIWADVEPEMRRESARSRPMLMQRLAALYASRLSESEIIVLNRFYRSPTGQKIIRRMHADVDYAPIVNDLLATDGARVSVQAVRSMGDKGKARLYDELTDSDKEALTELARSLPMAKVQKAVAEIQQAAADWMNEPDPELEARMAGLMEKAARRYFKEHPPEK